MVEQVQYFKIASLLFTSNINILLSINSSEIKEIQARFSNIMNSFIEKGTNKSINYIKEKDILPYESKVRVGKMGNHLILNFKNDFNNPCLFILDIKEQKVKNYIDIQLAKEILNNEIYDTMQEELHKKKNLTNIIKNVKSIEKFIKEFEKQMELHKNSNTITGYDCFEIDLNNYNER